VKEGGHGRSDQAKKTSQTLVMHPKSSHKNPRSSTHSHFHPYRKSKYPTKTSGHSTTTTTMGIFSPETRRTPYLSYNAGSCRFCACLRLDRRSRWRLRAEVRRSFKIFGLASVELDSRSWMGTGACVVHRYVMVFF